MARKKGASVRAASGTTRALRTRKAPGKAKSAAGSVPSRGRSRKGGAALKSRPTRKTPLGLRLLQVLIGWPKKR